MKGKDIEESITLKLIVSPFVGVYVFFVVRGGCALFSVSLISWEQRKLSELVEKYEDPVETPHDGYTRLGIRSHAKGTFHEYVKPGHELETAQMHRVAANRLIFNITFAWEHAVAITDENDAGKLVSHRFPQFTLSDALRPEFLKYVILDEDFHHNLYLSSPGGAGRNRVLKTDEALDYPIYYPSADEQHTIGTFLDKLTDLITLHQSKLFEHNKKKTCQFMISWEQRKFSDLYQKNDERNNGQFGWNKTISTSTMTFNEIGNGAADSSIDNYKVLRIGDIAFEGHTNKEFRYGRFVLNDIGDGIMSPRFATLRPIIKQDFSFWKHYIHNERIMRKKLVRSTKAGTMMNELVIDDLMEQLILVPSLQEQKKIGAFFGGLNHLITLHQRKLSYYRNRSILYGSF